MVVWRKSDMSYVCSSSFLKILFASKEVNYSCQTVHCIIMWVPGTRLPNICAPVLRRPSSRRLHITLVSALEAQSVDSWGFKNCQ